MINSTTIADKTPDRLNDSRADIDEVHGERDGEHAMPPAGCAKRQRTPPAGLRPTRMPRLRRLGRRVGHVGSKLLALLALLNTRPDFREIAARLVDDHDRMLTPGRPAELVKQQRTPPAERRPTRMPRLRRFGRRVGHIGSKVLELLELISPF